MHDSRLEVGLRSQSPVNVGGIILGQLFLQVAYTLTGLGESVLECSDPSSGTFVCSREEIVAAD